MGRRSDIPSRALNARIRATTYKMAEDAAEQQSRSLTGFVQRLLEVHLKITPEATCEEERWLLRAVRTVREKGGDISWAAALLNVEASARKFGAAMPGDMHDALKARKAGQEIPAAGTDR